MSSGSTGCREAILRWQSLLLSSCMDEGFSMHNSLIFEPICRAHANPLCVCACSVLYLVNQQPRSVSKTGGVAGYRNAFPQHDPTKRLASGAELKGTTTDSDFAIRRAPWRRGGVVTAAYPDPPITFTSGVTPRIRRVERLAAQ